MSCWQKIYWEVFVNFSLIRFSILCQIVEFSDKFCVVNSIKNNQVQLSPLRFFDNDFEYQNAVGLSTLLDGHENLSYLMLLKTQKKTTQFKW